MLSSCAVVVLADIASQCPTANVLLYLHYKTGLMALHLAMIWGADKTIFQQLLAYGANPNLMTHFGQTPLAIAHDMGNPDIVALLKQTVKKDKRKQQNGQSASNVGH